MNDYLKEQGLEKPPRKGLGLMSQLKVAEDAYKAQKEATRQLENKFQKEYVRGLQKGKG